MSQQEESQTSKWWESYLVRYLTGSIAGSIFITAISLKNDLIKIDGDNIGTHLIAIGVLGVGFCYIASTPITVMHVGRNDKSIPEKHIRHLWLSWVIILLATLTGNINFLGRFSCMEWVIGIAGAALTIVSTGNEFQQKQPPILRFIAPIFSWTLIMGAVLGRLIGHFQITKPEWWVTSIPVLWVCLGQYIALYRILNNKEKLLEFYRNLSKARNAHNSKDIRDTYTHLREHSNSIFIVTIEISLISLFIAIRQTFLSSSNIGLIDEKTGWVTISIMLIWILPTVFMWSRANELEEDFSKNEGLYGKNHTT